jgi:hypothetical protein
MIALNTQIIWLVQHQDFILQSSLDPESSDILFCCFTIIQVPYGMHRFLLYIILGIEATNHTQYKNKKSDDFHSQCIYVFTSGMIDFLLISFAFINHSVC